jgi:putative membrane protein
VIAHTALAVQAAMLVLVGLATAAYAIGWASRPTPLAPAASWGLGVAAALVADSPPMQDVAERSFTGHMAQHLVIMCVAAPGLVLARPFEVVGRLVPAPVAVPARRAARRWSAAAVIARPAVAVVLLVLIHLTSFYERALRSPVVHLVEHGGFLLVGSLLWGAVLAPIAHRGAWRVTTAFATIAATAFLGMVIAASRTPIAAFYIERQGVDAALEDQRLGASLMWVGGMAITLPLAMVALWRWAAAEERATQHREQIARRMNAARRPSSGPHTPN